MAKSLNDYVRDALGDQVFLILTLQAANAELVERIAALTPTPPAAETVASPLESSK